MVSLATGGRNRSVLTEKRTHKLRTFRNFVVVQQEHAGNEVSLLFFFSIFVQVIASDLFKAPFSTTPFPVKLQIWKAILCITSAFSGAKNQTNFPLVTDRRPALALFTFESRNSCRRLESVLKGLRLFQDCCF